MQDGLTGMLTKLPAKCTIWYICLRRINVTGRQEGIMAGGGVERASITINAPIDVVWSVFTDVERWPTWASSFTSVELVDGPMRLGAKARIRQPRLPTVV